MQFEIKTDPLFISQRIKELDKDYYIVFNIAKNKYELHHRTQPFCSYCLTYPHPALDERFVELARKTSRENVDDLLLQIDKENEKLQKGR